MAGVPLLNGFLSKEMFFAETLDLDAHRLLEWIVPIVATIAAALAVAYSVRFIHDVFFNGQPVGLPRRRTSRRAGCACRWRSWSSSASRWASLRRLDRRAAAGGDGERHAGHAARVQPGALARVQRAAADERDRDGRGRGLLLRPAAVHQPAFGDAPAGVRQARVRRGGRRARDAGPQRCRGAAVGQPAAATSRGSSSTAFAADGVAAVARFGIRRGADRRCRPPATRSRRSAAAVWLLGVAAAIAGDLSYRRRLTALVLLGAAGLAVSLAVRAVLGARPGADAAAGRGGHHRADAARAALPAADVARRNPARAGKWRDAGIAGAAGVGMRLRRVRGAHAALRVDFAVLSRARRCPKAAAPTSST